MAEGTTTTETIKTETVIPPDAPIPDTPATKTTVETTAPVAPGTSTTTTATTITEEQSVTMRLAVIFSIVGMIIIGGISIFYPPQFETGVTLVLSTLNSIVSAVIGGKLGLAQGNGGGKMNGGSTTNGNGNGNGAH